MIYKLRHVTTYRYQRPVAFTRCTLRLYPRGDNGQKVHEYRLVVSPTPAQNQVRTDFFGNRLASLVVDTPHKDFQISVSGLIEVDRPSSPHASLTPAWRQVKRAAIRSQTLAATAPAHYIYRSSLVPILPEIADYARVSFPQDRPVLEAAIDLMQRIKRDFAYDPEATEISTPVADAFAKRTGVCQDFAHIMIAGLRGIGLPAAYVSGYIRTIPAPGKPRLEGADASHAWVSLWCGAEFGWHDLDPTNAIQLGNDHIVLAVGRDYNDVSPMDGVIVGSGGQKLTVNVDVIPAEPADVMSRTA